MHRYQINYGYIARQFRCLKYQHGEHTHVLWSGCRKSIRKHSATELPCKVLCSKGKWQRLSPYTTKDGVHTPRWIKRTFNVRRILYCCSTITHTRQCKMRRKMLAIWLALLFSKLKNSPVCSAHVHTCERVRLLVSSLCGDYAEASRLLSRIRHVFAATNYNCIHMGSSSHTFINCLSSPQSKDVCPASKCRPPFIPLAVTACAAFNASRRHPGRFTFCVLHKDNIYTSEIVCHLFSGWTTAALFLLLLFYQALTHSHAAASVDSVRHTAIYQSTIPPLRTYAHTAARAPLLPQKKCVCYFRFSTFHLNKQPTRGR